MKKSEEILEGSLVDALRQSFKLSGMTKKDAAHSASVVTRVLRVQAAGQIAGHLAVLAGPGHTREKVANDALMIASVLFDRG